MNWLTILNREIVECTRCPRLVAYRQEVARVKRRAYLSWHYWGKPVAGFGDPHARVLIMGLAPARTDPIVLDVRSPAMPPASLCIPCCTRLDLPASPRPSTGTTV